MEKELTATEAEAARKEQQLAFDRAALDGLPEVMTHQDARSLRRPMAAGTRR